jgi:hypothetical protein
LLKRFGQVGNLLSKNFLPIGTYVLWKYFGLKVQPIRPVNFYGN